MLIEEPAMMLDPAVTGVLPPMIPVGVYPAPAGAVVAAPTSCPPPVAFGAIVPCERKAASGY